MTPIQSRTSQYGVEAQLIKSAEKHSSNVHGKRHFVLEENWEKKKLNEPERQNLERQNSRQQAKHEKRTSDVL